MPVPPAEWFAAGLWRRQRKVPLNVSFLIFALRCIRSQPLRHLAPGPPRPGLGVLFPRRKSTQKGAGDTPAPFVCPIGRYQGRYPVATEFPQSLRLPRNRCGVLRTSPVGPRADGCFLPHKIDSSIPSKGRQPKPDEKPAADQIPKNLVQWLRSIKSDTDRLGKKRGPGCPRRFFRPLLGVQKWTRRRQNSAEGRCPPIRRHLAEKALLQQPLLPEGHIGVIRHDDVVRQADMHRLQGLFDL